jgi:hypothetical protein
LNGVVAAVGGANQPCEGARFGEALAKIGSAVRPAEAGGCGIPCDDLHLTPLARRERFAARGIGERPRRRADRMRAGRRGQVKRRSRERRERGGHCKDPYRHRF